MHLACRYGHHTLVRDLMTQYEMDPNEPKNVSVCTSKVLCVIYSIEWRLICQIGPRSKGHYLAYQLPFMLYTIHEVVVMLRLTKDKRQRPKTLFAAVVGKDHLLPNWAWKTQSHAMESQENIELEPKQNKCLSLKGKISCIIKFCCSFFERCEKVKEFLYF